MSRSFATIVFVPRLTKKEARVFGMKSQGWKAAAIAGRTNLSKKQVRKIIKRIREKTGVTGCFVEAKRRQEDIRLPLELLDERPLPRRLVAHPGLAGSQHMTLPLTRNEFSLHEAFAELVDRASLKMSELHLSLIGPGNILPDTALAIRDVLNRRTSGMRLVMDSYSSLINADVLVWLSGDERRLRDHGWVSFQRPDTSPRRLRIPSEHPDGFQTDYAAVYRLITEQLPREFAGRRIFPAELSEWLVEKFEVENREFGDVSSSSIGQESDQRAK